MMAVSFSALPTEMGLQTLLLMTATITDGLMKPIFDKLLIWTKDSAGNDKLCAIGKAGVGAIYLGNSDTEFSLKSSANTTNAIVRKTGLFLYENGGCGTIQQMDLAT